MKGLLLLQLGTPDDPSPAAVRRYLSEFLSDPMVLDINPIGRWALLNLIILPTRPAKSAAAYQKIWTDEGSPLRIHGEALVDALSTRLGDDYEVAIGMRYGSGSIAEALDKLDRAGVDEIVVLPLYPQYAMSSTGTALAKLYEVAAERSIVPPLQVIPDFYAHPGYLDTVANMMKQHQADFNPDHVLFSYHGLPERHVVKSARSGQHCLVTDNCCDSINPANRSCYRAQCYATTRGLVERLQLQPDGYSQGFQSRLGRTPWIKPYTDEVIPTLLERGVKRLMVACPSFVADCLETLEEIGLEAKHDFIEAGGEDFALVPCLNSDPAWADVVADMIRLS